MDRRGAEDAQRAVQRRADHRDHPGIRRRGEGRGSVPTARQRRIESHAHGQVTSTKAYPPVRLKSYVAVRTAKTARDLERYLNPDRARRLPTRDFGDAVGVEALAEAGAFPPLIDIVRADSSRVRWRYPAISDQRHSRVRCDLRQRDAEASPARSAFREWGYEHIGYRCRPRCSR